MRRYKIIYLVLILLALGAGCAAPPPVSSPAAGFRVALLLPAAGESATQGRLLRNGILTAFDAWNDSHPPLQQVAWQTYHTPCRYEPARQAARQAIDDGFNFIIGPLCSEAAIAAAASAQAAGALLITPTAAHPRVTVDPQGRTRPTVFRVSPTLPHQGEAAARFAAGVLQARTAAVLTRPTDEYSISLTTAFTQQFTQHGGQILYQASYLPNQPDFSALLAALDQQPIDLIYLPAPAAIVNKLASELKRPGPVLLGSDLWDSPELDRALLEGAYFTTWFAPVDSPTFKTWGEAYQSVYAADPDPLAALGYSAAQLLLTALEKSANATPAAVAAELEQISWPGFTGPVSFDAQHNLLTAIPVIQISAGQTGVSAWISLQP